MTFEVSGRGRAGEDDTQNAINDDDGWPSGRLGSSAHLKPKEHLMGDSKADDVKEALARDLEQTKADLPGLEGEDLDQDADDTVRQALGKDDK